MYQFVVSLYTDIGHETETGKKHLIDIGLHTLVI